MDRKTIAIDIDDVLVPSAEVLVDFYNRKYNRDFNFEHFTRNDLVYEAGKIHEAEGTEFNADELIFEVEKFFMSGEFSNQLPFKGSIEAIRVLARKFNLVIVTARHSTIHDQTKEWLRLHFPDIFGAIEFANSGKWGYPHSVSKVEIMKRHKVDYLVDDSLYNILPAAEAGITGLLFGDYPWSSSPELPDDVVRVKNWQEVLDYFNDKS